jgi:hypothetical protein
LITHCPNCQTALVRGHVALKSPETALWRSLRCPNVHCQLVRHWREEGTCRPDALEVEEDEGGDE